jgi:hypothetical protein
MTVAGTVLASAARSPRSVAAETAHRRTSSLSGRFAGRREGVGREGLLKWLIEAAEPTPRSTRCGSIVRSSCSPTPRGRVMVGLRGEHALSEEYARRYTNAARATRPRRLRSLRRAEHDCPCCSTPGAVSCARVRDGGGVQRRACCATRSWCGWTASATCSACGSQEIQGRQFWMQVSCGVAATRRGVHFGRVCSSGTATPRGGAQGTAAAINPAARRAFTS